MSWSGFKKNMGRATTQVMMKTGHVEKTSDREYEVEERRYRTLESASLRLQKESRGYLDSLRAMTASQMRIAETIDAFYGDSGAKDGVSRSYKQAVEDLDAETVKALDGPYRSVTRELWEHVWDEDEREYDTDEIAKIEAEMNMTETGRHGSYTRGFAGMEALEESFVLMDFIYRTTVLEPIGRFCAYFPDINECIKKRNHKMLDYDAMRAKVKKLVEKPDKDPSKLPRAEKETEMVSTQNSLRKSEEQALLDPELDLEIPSPPKNSTTMENYLRVNRLRQEDAGSVNRHSGSSLGRTPSVLSSLSSKLASGSVEAMLQRSSTVASRSSSSRRSGFGLTKEAGRDMHPSLQRGSSCGSGMTIARTSQPLSSPGVSHSRTLSYAPSTSSVQRKRISTPFLQPSELEDIMKPLREEYIRTQTDMMKQAKVAYDQLNEQLTNELPQLIDLRVPYLDPTFEALVKIQLRFCAEAYSRMAQVQQYLDASTRDQYASGDLDARVEDVLGQIRELSIAGTV